MEKSQITEESITANIKIKLNEVDNASCPMSLELSAKRILQLLNQGTQLSGKRIQFIQAERNLAYTIEKEVWHTRLSYEKLNKPKSNKIREAEFKKDMEIAKLQIEVAVFLILD